MRISKGIKLTVEFFVTDFAVCFRYRFLNESPGLMINVRDEITATTIPLLNSDGTPVQSIYRPYGVNIIRVTFPVFIIIGIINKATLEHLLHRHHNSMIMVMIPFIFNRL